MAGERSPEQALVQMIEMRITTRQEDRSNQGRGPHRSREQVEILKEVGKLKAAFMSK
jgi:hypothetical protein